MTAPDPQNRRPIASRRSRWAGHLTARAIRFGLTPNQISQASIGFAALGLGFYAMSMIGPALFQSVMFVLAAAMIQARLICNLIDGLVAVEGGLGAKDGPFWNEAPDRLSDFLFLLGAGLAAGNPGLGAAAAALAIATAYIRELGRAEGAQPDFSGPLAKPQRMAILTIGTIIAAVFGGASTLSLTLWIIVAGTGLTIVRRSIRLIQALKSRS